MRTFDSRRVRDAIEFQEVQGDKLAFSISNTNRKRSAIMKEYYTGQTTRNSKPQVNILGQRCKVIHKIDDGYWLMEFPEIKLYNMKQRKKLPLRWYIHKDDLIELK